MNMPPAAGQPREDRDMRQLVDSLLAHWRLFIISIALGVAVAYVVTRYSNPVFGVRGSVLIATTGGDPAVMLFGESMFGRSEQVANQTVIARSMPIIMAAIDSLPIQAVIHREGTLRDIELYKIAPFEIRKLRPTPDASYQLVCFLKPLTPDSFQFWVSHRKKKQEILAPKTYRYGQTIHLVDSFDIQILPKVNQEPGVDPYKEVYRFTFQNREELAYSYHNRLKVKLEDEESSILNLELEGSTPTKEIDLINAVMEQLMLASLREKNQVATNTVTFLERELKGIKDSLTDIEYQLEQFKSGQALFSLGSENQAVTQLLEQTASDRARLDLQRKYVDYLQRYLEGETGADQLISPSAFGISDPNLNQSTQELVGLSVEKAALRREGNARNPLVQELIGQIESKEAILRQNLRDALRKLAASNRIALADVNQRLNQAEGRARQLPRSERRLVNIQRIYSLSERLYLLMMEKKAEAEISRSSNTPDLRVVEPARLLKLEPKSPKKLINLLIGFAAGLLLPVVYVLLKDLFNNRVTSREDLKPLAHLPFLGEVPNAKGHQYHQLVDNPRSSLAETLRSIRSNLHFLLPLEGPRTILFTSGISGEGKSFTSLHLASLLAISGQSTVIVDADMRRPRLHHQLRTLPSPGLSNYLHAEATMDDVLYQTSIPNLSVIRAGDLPPNPADLLMEPALATLLETLKSRFTFVIIDAPPALIVSDAQVLLPFADVCVLVVRAHHARKESIHRLAELVQRNSSAHFAVMLNDVRTRAAMYYTYYSDAPVGAWARARALFTLWRSK